MRIGSITTALAAVALLWSQHAVHAQSIPGELLVTLDAQRQPLILANDLSYIRGVESSQRIGDTGNHYLVRTQPTVTLSVLEHLSRDPRIRSVQPNYLYRALFAPNDPSYRYQWNFTKVNAPTAWDFDAKAPFYGGDPSVVVAVLDTGVSFEDYSTFKKAPDFSGTTFVTGTDLVNNDAHPNDDHGHGTHVAMTIAETTDNNLSGAGLAFASSIMPVKVLDASGVGSTATIAAGIDFARKNGATIISLSLGGSNDDPLMHTAIQNAVKQGIVVVAATGNDGASSVYYPARYDEVLAVGSTRYDDARASYSNRGTGIDLVAPGGELDLDQNADGQPDGIVQQTCTNGACNAFADFFYEGTSQAAPHVSAAAALLLAAGISSSKVASLLEGSATDLGSTGYDTDFGWGLLNVSKALSLALNDSSPPSGTIAVEQGSEFFNSPLVTLTLSAQDGESNVVSASFSNNGSTFSDWETYTPTRVKWDCTTLGGSSSDGTKTVYVRFRDAAGNISASVSDSIVLDATTPAVPKLFIHPQQPNDRVQLHSGIATSVRIISADWPGASDALSGVVGYRVLFSPDPTPDFSSVPLTTELSYTAPETTSSRTLYLHVVAVDAAGNHSDAATFVYVYQELRIVAGASTNSGRVSVVDKHGHVQRQLQPFGKQFRGGVDVASIVPENGRPEQFLVAPVLGPGAVKIIDTKGQSQLEFIPYGGTNPGGIHVASTPGNSDGDSNIVLAPGRGSFPVRIFNLKGKKQREFWPFGKEFIGDMSLSIGNFSGTKKIVVADASGSTLVRVFSSLGKRKRQFYGFSKKAGYGLNVATGDVNGDGSDEIVVAPRSGAAQVRVFSEEGKLKKQFFVLSKKFRGGLSLATGDYDGDGRDEIFTAPARGAGQVSVFSGEGALVKRLFVMPKNFRGGVRLTTIR